MNTNRVATIVSPDGSPQTLTPCDNNLFLPSLLRTLVHQPPSPSYSSISSDWLKRLMHFMYSIVKESETDRGDKHPLERWDLPFYNFCEAYKWNAIDIHTTTITQNLITLITICSLVYSGEEKIKTLGNSEMRCMGRVRVWYGRGRWVMAVWQSGRMLIETGLSAVRWNNQD